jgi:RES domain-containing protein
MNLVRVARRQHVRSAFTGEGARRFRGRWNRWGTPMVNLSQSLSLAARETGQRGFARRPDHFSPYASTLL